MLREMQMLPKVLGFALCLGIYISLSVPARAQLLIDPSGGAVLFDDSAPADDIGSSPRSLGFTGYFFGAQRTDVTVSVNGNLNFSGDVNYFNVPMPDAQEVARVSPLWDDLVIQAGDGASIIEKVQSGSYYSVSWLNMESATSSTGRQSFQAAWFGAPSDVGSFHFLTDDIAFSYAAVGATFADHGDDYGATVGLDAGNLSVYSILPDSDSGEVDDAHVALIPTNEDFVLFRPDGQGSYNASIEHFTVAPVPEPGSFIGLMVGFLLLGMLLVRRAR